MEATQLVLESDPERGAELSNLVSQALLDYAVALKSVLMNAPDVVKPAVEKALLVSQDGAGDEIEIVGIVVSISDTELGIDGEIYLINELTELEDLIAVGDMVKVHVILTTDGLMIAREIELTSEFEDDSIEGGGDEHDENEDTPGDIESKNESLDDDESDDNDNGNESDDNDNESEDDVTDNESDDHGNDNESDDDDNENISKENENDDESDDDDNDNDPEDDEDENESHDDGEEDEGEDDNDD